MLKKPNKLKTELKTKDILIVHLLADYKIQLQVDQPWTIY